MKIIPLLIVLIAVVLVAGGIMNNACKSSPSRVGALRCPPNSITYKLGRGDIWSLPDTSTSLPLLSS
jgi:hypothetical protein